MYHEHIEKHEVAAQRLEEDGFDDRFENFRASLLEIEALNARAEQAGLAPTFMATHFADLSVDEFRRIRSGLLPASDNSREFAKPVLPTQSGQPNARQAPVVPRAIDWRLHREAEDPEGYDKGPVSPVKNQGLCGSCWAFAATAQIESEFYLTAAEGREGVRGITHDLSEAQIAGCTYNWADSSLYNSFGPSTCDTGGRVEDAFEVFHDFGGLMREDAPIPEVEHYPSMGYDHQWSVDEIDKQLNGVQCRPALYHRESVIASNSDKDDETLGPVTAKNAFWLLNQGDGTRREVEAQMMELIQNAPMVVSIYANNAMMHHHGNVVWGTQPAHCEKEEGEEDVVANHAVQVVGYQPQDADHNDPYWIIKNSYGTTWGDEGFLYLKAGEGACGIGSLATAFNRGMMSPPLEISYTPSEAPEVTPPEVAPPDGVSGVFRDSYKTYSSGYMRNIVYERKLEDGTTVSFHYRPTYLASECTGPDECNWVEDEAPAGFVFDSNELQDTGSPGRVDGVFDFSTTDRGADVGENEQPVQMFEPFYTSRWQAKDITICKKVRGITDAAITYPHDNGCNRPIFRD